MESWLGKNYKGRENFKTTFEKNSGSRKKPRKKFRTVRKAKKIIQGLEKFQQSSKATKNKIRVSKKIQIVGKPKKQNLKCIEKIC